MIEKSMRGLRLPPLMLRSLRGDPVNTANRMESHGLSNQIQVSEGTYELLKEKFLLEPRGEIDVSGKGLMKTFWLKDRLAWLASPHILPLAKLDIFAYISITDYGQFLEVAEDWNLRNIEIGRKAGPRLALANSPSYSEQSKDVESQWVLETEAQMKEWGENYTFLYTKSSEEQIRELGGSLDFPSNGIGSGRIVDRIYQEDLS